MWKMAGILPIPKVYPPTSIQTDLRPISLTASISKQFESIVDECILLHVRDQLNPCQYGSLKGRPATHALIDMLHHWFNALDRPNGKSARVLLVDFAKAFAHVDHTTELQKLCNYGVPKFIIDWLASSLTCRQQRVKIANVCSDWVTLRREMPQVYGLDHSSF